MGLLIRSSLAKLYRVVLFTFGCEMEVTLTRISTDNRHWRILL